MILKRKVQPEEPRKLAEPKNSAGYRILIEDESIVGVFKTPGMLSQGDETGDPDLVSVLKLRYRREANRFVGLVHRLDRPACGVMVLARTPEAAAALSRQIVDGTWRKTYLAVVHGRPPVSGSLQDGLRIDRESRKTLTTEKGESGTKEAYLDYSVLAAHGERSLLKIQLHTGKKHQIRAQLASRGYPVVGDRKYGSREVLRDPGMIALCAWSLEFKHPVTGKAVRLDAPRPEHWPWHDPKLFVKKTNPSVRKPPVTTPVRKPAVTTPVRADTSVKPAARRKPGR